MKTRKKLPFGTLIKLTLRHSWRASPPMFSALILSSILLCALQIIEIFAMKNFFDTIVTFASGACRSADVIFAGLPIAAILIFGPAVYIGEYLAQGYFWRRGSGYLLSLYHIRAGKLSLMDFEAANTFDDMKKAGLGSEDAPAASRSVIQFFFYYLPFLLFTSIFLWTIKPLLVFALFFIFGSVLLSQLIRAAKIYQFEDQNAGLKRQVEYYEGCITAKEYFKETRTLGVFRYFHNLLIEATKRFTKASMQLEKKIALIESLLRMINVLGYAGIIGLLLYYVFDGTVSVGAFASVFYSIDRINNILRRMVEDVGEAVKNMKTTSFLLDYLDAPQDKLKKEPLEKAVEIHIKNVSFSYPGGENVLKHINLEIRQGETLAIVGENGAGKTTLTKLITGIYQPTEGTIAFAGHDISLYSPRWRYQSISSVFQSFNRYKMTAGENIRISEISSELPLDAVIKTAGVHMDRFMQGLDTMLSREYGGTELSGGQWQRIAIARGLYRQHDLIVLDEPTAAIDPIEESNIFKLFKESAKNKTTILVTHRLGSAKIADRIIVMENGKIVEQGNHLELMQLGGMYSSMFLEQAKWYERS